MFYAILKALHLLSVIAWVGGMFFMLVCVRPAAGAVLGPPARVRVLQAILGRFFAVVIVAAAVVLLSGGAMIGSASREATRAGLRFNMPLDWYAMAALFFVMLAVFAHIRLVLFRKLKVATSREAWPDAAAALSAIRWEVLINLVLGIFIVVMVRLGGAA